MMRRLVGFTLLACCAVVASFAQDVASLTPPAPQRLVVHSKVLNEDRIVWVRVPSGYEQGKSAFPVLYLTDGPGHINEIGSTIDFLVANDRMPKLIVVGIANTDRTRDLTPTHADGRNPDGTIQPFPTSGGADKFLDFIQTELMPEIQSRYRTAPYRVFAGHSFGGLFAIHTLATRPDLFNAYIAVSPSLQWDDGSTLREAQAFLAAHKELNKRLFVSLASEGNTPNPMGANFDQFRKSLESGAPKQLVWKVERYPDEDHGSTVLRAHYAGLRTVFGDWQIERDQKTFMPVGGLAGVERHYRELSERYGYTIPVPETTVNQLGYQFMAAKKLDEAIAVFKRNVELYPNSANVYDSLAEGLENAGKFDEALKNQQKAVETATANHDPLLPQIQKRLEAVTASAKTAKSKAAEAK